MNWKRAVMMAVLVLAITALAVPMVSLKARAAAGEAKVATSKALTTAASLPTQQESATARSESASQANPAAEKINLEILRGMGLGRKSGTQKLKAKKSAGSLAPQSGTPRILSGRCAFSAALA